jgi:hypothetical protein
VVKPSVEFLAEFPDDALCDEDGAELQFAGRNVAETVAAALTARAYVVSDPEDCQELGWELEARHGGCRFWIRLTKIGAFVVVTQDMTFRLWPKRPTYLEFLQDLDAALGSDPRFSQVRWFKDVLPSDGGDWSAQPA